MKTKAVTVLPYDEKWQQDFAAIKAELAPTLQGLIISIEHVGSTSVPGLAAKPIIDIDVVIPDRDLFPQVVEKLAELGYIHEGDLGIPDREAFKYADKPHLQKHHLYVCPQNSRELHRHLTFRDYLRSHPDAVREYGDVKLRAAAQHPDNIDGYMAQKGPCIEKLYRLCGLG